MKTTIEKMTLEQMARKLKKNRIISSLLEKEEKALKALIMEEKPLKGSTLQAGKFIISFNPGSKFYVDMAKLETVFGKSVNEDRFRSSTEYTSIKILG
jgi:hypothetical protein